MKLKFINRLFLLTILSFFATNNAIAQLNGPKGFDFTKQLWTGLRKAQAEEELPKGNAPFQTTKRLKKEDIRTRLVKVGDNDWEIKDGWELTDEETVLLSGKNIFDTTLDTSEWYNATVPGTVLTTLVNQGVYPDPYYGLNNMSIPDSLSTTVWWYRTTFELPLAIKNDNINLLFNGINYAAEIYLNGKKVGTMKGAFKRGEFNITNLLKKNGENVLAIKILPPPNAGIPHEQSMIAGQGLNGGNLSEDGPTFISSIGWDWIPGIRDRNAGIWQDVILRATGKVTIGDPLITSTLNLPDTTQAKISVMVPLKNISDKPIDGKLIAELDGKKIEQSFKLEAKQEKEIELLPTKYKNLIIKKPKLWWPNGYGAQNLYDIDFIVETNGEKSDTKSTRFGIRELSYELMLGNQADSTKFTRVLYTPTRANNDGKPIFDYVNRVMYDKASGNQLPTLRESVDLNKVGGFEILSDDDPVGPFIVFRVNGQRIFVKGGNWGMDDGMKRVSREKLEPYFQLTKNENLNMIRNWTGESTEEDFYALADEYGILIWNDFWMTTDDTVEPQDFVLFEDNARDAVKRFRNHPSIAIWVPRNEGFAPEELGEMLEDMMAKEDPTRHYHGQSRYLNMGTSGPWGHFENPEDYYVNNAKGFNTEMGTFAIPTVETIKKFIPKEDQWPINDVWAYHDLHHTTQNFDGYMKDVERYGKPQSMEQFVKQAHLIDYDAWRAMIEAWNSKMWDNTTGLLLWMSHPAWPSFIWQTYSYDYETPASFFGTKKAAEPVHIQMNLDNDEIIAVNTTLKDVKDAKLSMEYYDLNGKLLLSENKEINVKANGITDIMKAPKPNNLPELYLVRLVLRNKTRPISRNDYWVTNGGQNAYEQMSKIPQVELNIYKGKTDAKGITLVEVENPSENNIATAIKLNAIDSNTGAILLPAFFSDGYFNLLPKERRLIWLNLPDATSTNFDVVATGYNISN